MKKIFLLLIAGLFIVSCKKESSEINLSGSLFDSYAGNYVAGATVSIQANGVVGGIYNAGYTTVASGVTDANGHFEFIIDESAYDSFRFTFIKDGYFVTQEIKTAGNIDPENPFNGSFNIYSKSIIKLHVQNINPYDNQDIISFYFVNPPSYCSDCCVTGPIQMEGTNIDTTIYCNSYGDYDLRLSYSYTKNNTNYIYNDTLHTIASDTTFHEILF